MTDTPVDCARVFRMQNVVLLSTEPDEAVTVVARPGDLVVQSAFFETTWWMRTFGPPGSQMAWRELPETDEGDFVIEDSVMHLSACTDALAHYRDACRAEQTAAVRLLLSVRPTDAGFRAAFACREADWLLCRQWKRVELAMRDNEWWIEDIDYGLNWTDETPFSDAVLTRRKVAANRWQLPEHRRRLGQTQDIRPAVAAYRALLEPSVTSYLVFHEPLRELTGAGLFCHLEHCLSAVQRHVLDEFDRNTGHFSDRTLVVYCVRGPARYDRAAVARLIDEMCERAFRRANRLLAIVEKSGQHVCADWPRLIEPIQFDYSAFAAHCDPATFEYTRIWAVRPEFQWPAVQRAVLDAALALAPLRLPPYVLLEILEWLPALRHHVHASVIGLIEAIRASVQRVYQARRNQ